MSMVSEIVKSLRVEHEIRLVALTSARHTLRQAMQTGSWGPAETETQAAHVVEALDDAVRYYELLIESVRAAEGMIVEASEPPSTPS